METYVSAAPLPLAFVPRFVRARARTLVPPDFIAAIGAHNSRVACVSAHLRRGSSARGSSTRGPFPLFAAFIGRARTYRTCTVRARIHHPVDSVPNGRSRTCTFASIVSSLFCLRRCSPRRGFPRLLRGSSLVFLARHEAMRNGEARIARDPLTVSEDTHRVNVPRRSDSTRPVPLGLEEGRPDEDRARVPLFVSLRRSDRFSPVNRRFIGRRTSPDERPFRYATKGSDSRERGRERAIERGCFGQTREAVAAAAVRYIRATW